MQMKGISLLVLGTLVAVTTVSVVFAAGWRPPPTGSWQCFRTDRFPDPAAERGPTQASVWDPARAADDHVAQVFAQGLNKVAANSAVGSVLAVQLEPPIGGRYPAICVKY
jgi:hypothetical protein